MYQEDRIWDAYFFPDNYPPQNQENNLDPHEPKVLLFGTLRKQESTGQAALRNISELEKTPEAIYDQRVLT